jgi:hypothetical protein
VVVYALMSIVTQIEMNGFESAYNSHSSGNSLTKPSKVNYVEQVNTSIVRKVQSVEDLVRLTKNQAQLYGDSNSQIFQLESLCWIMRHRFQHAYAIYQTNENWLAVWCGKFLWHDLSAIVIPDDILKHKVAACSQVSIVIMAACKRLGFPYRKIALNGHYTLEANVGGKWYYIDADLKPDFLSIGGRKSLGNIIENEYYYKLYHKSGIDSAELRRIFSQVNYGAINAEPAPRARLFHVATKFVSLHWRIIFYILFTYYFFRFNYLIIISKRLILSKSSLINVKRSYCSNSFRVSDP